VLKFDAFNESVLLGLPGATKC